MNVSEGNNAYLSAAVGDVDHQRWQWREHFWITECLAYQGEQTLETASRTTEIRCTLATTLIFGAFHRIA